MATSSFDSIFSFGSTRVIVPPGATQAVLLTVNPGDNYTFLKYGSGGSMEIFGIPEGTTATAAQLVSAKGNHYLMGTELIPINGPSRFYLVGDAAGGATGIAYLLRGRSQGANALVGGSTLV